MAASRNAVEFISRFDAVRDGKLADERATWRGMRTAPARTTIQSGTGTAKGPR